MTAPDPADVAELVKLTAEAIHRDGHSHDCDAGPMPWHVRAAETALAVIAPRIQAAEREKYIALAEQHKAHVWVLRQSVMPLGSRHMAEEPFADLLRRTQ